MTDIVVPKWQYQDTNIEGAITQKDFTRGDRTVIYTSPTPLPTESATTMKAMGLLQGMSHSEQKQLQLIFELGSAAPMIVPGLTQGQLQLSRVLINGMDFLNTIYHGANPETKLTDAQILRSIRDVNRPFDMLMAQYPVLDDGTAAQAVFSVVFRGCQIQARNMSVSPGGVVTLEQMSLMYTTIPKVTFKAAA